MKMEDVGQDKNLYFRIYSSDWIEAFRCLVYTRSDANFESFAKNEDELAKKSARYSSE